MLELLFVGFATIDVYEDQALLSGAAASMACNASFLGLSASVMCPLSSSQGGQGWKRRFLDSKVNTDLCIEVPEIPRCLITDRYGMGTTRIWKGDIAINVMHMTVFPRDLLSNHKANAIVTANAHPMQVSFVRTHYSGPTFYIPGPQIVNNHSYLDTEFMKKTPTIFANEEEAPVIVNAINEANIRATLIVTLGERGCQVIKDSKVQYILEAPPVDNVIDTTGAGDCFALGYIVATLNNAGIPESVRFGQQLSKQIIQKLGTLLEGEAPAQICDEKDI